jgi:hypothetical protein
MRDVFSEVFPFTGCSAEVVVLWVCPDFRRFLFSTATSPFCAPPFLFQTLSFAVAQR